MKNATNKLLIVSWLIALSILILSFSSCKAKPIETTSIEVVKDSVSDNVIVNRIKEVSKAIKDSNAVVLPLIKTGVKDCDSICNTKCDELLAMLNFYKKSGDNKSKSFYNKETRLYTQITELGETISTLKDSLNQKVRIKEVYQDKVIKIPVKYIPKWIQYLAVMGVLFIFFLIWRIVKIFM